MASKLRNNGSAGDPRADECYVEADPLDPHQIDGGPVRIAFKILLDQGLLEDGCHGFVEDSVGSIDFIDRPGAPNVPVVRRFMQPHDTQQLGQFKAALRMPEAIPGKREAFGKAIANFTKRCALPTSGRCLRAFRAIMMALLRQTVFVESHDLRARHAEHMVCTG